jgi:hypothetical protein
MNYYILAEDFQLIELSCLYYFDVGMGMVL